MAHSDNGYKENGASYILKQLRHLNASHIFMVPGKLINSFMKCYPKDDDSVLDIFPVPIITACETGAAYMAEGSVSLTLLVYVSLLEGRVLQIP